MQRAIVSIGVKKTGGLPELPAAQESAAAFAEWARVNQGIPASRVKLITDAKGPVGRDRIFEAVEKITRLGFIEQLIVYFSGHGINSGLYEQWLLSRAPEDPNAAINVRGSEMLARFCGVGHVVFISDACRTAADSIQAQEVKGGEIFPNLKVRSVENPVDQYFATLVGNPAFEIRAVSDAASRYRAAYSTVLLDALKGNVPAIVDSLSGHRFVRPRSLKKHLLIAVPEYLHSLNLPGEETQQPDARIESDETAWIAELPAAPVSTAAASSVLRATPKRGTISAKSSATHRPRLTGEEDLPPPAVVTAARRPASDIAQAALNEFLSALDPASATRKRSGAPARPSGREKGPDKARALVTSVVASSMVSFGPDHFETQCGVKVRGGRIAQAWARHAQASVGKGRDVVQVKLDATRRGANVVVQLGDGTGVWTPMTWSPYTR